MIRRIVLLKLTDEHATEAGRAEVVAQALEVMPRVTGVGQFEVGRPADEASERSWDISLMMSLDGVEVLPAYQADRAHRVFVDEFLAPRVECVKAWNFQLG